MGEICEAKPNGAQECHGPPETDEQRSEREAKEKKERDCRKEIRDGLLDAYAFLERYPRSEDIEDERDREIVKTLRRIEKAKQRRDIQRHKVVELEKRPSSMVPSTLCLTSCASTSISIASFLATRKPMFRRLKGK